MVIGIGQYGSSFEGIAGLLEAVGNNGEIWINHLDFCSRIGREKRDKKGAKQLGLKG
jgi:hypothetical protein